MDKFFARYPPQFLDTVDHAVHTQFYINKTLRVGVRNSWSNSSAIAQAFGVEQCDVEYVGSVYDKYIVRGGYQNPCLMVCDGFCASHGYNALLPLVTSYDDIGYLHYCYLAASHIPSQLNSAALSVTWGI